MGVSRRSRVPERITRPDERFDSSQVDKVDLLRTVPGVGEQSSVTLLAPLPELGTLDRRHIAALGLGFLVWGLPPYHRLMMASRSVW